LNRSTIVFDCIAAKQLQSNFAHHFYISPVQQLRFYHTYLCSHVC